MDNVAKDSVFMDDVRKMEQAGNQEHFVTDMKIARILREHVV